MRAVIYHYWNDNNSQRWQDLANPVVLSIATLRAQDSDVAIYVIDISDKAGDWGSYPGKLGFRVVTQPPSIPIDHHPSISRNTLKFCSSIFDVTGLADRIDDTNIVFADSDLFFLKPLELDFGECFHCRDGYVGHYYYDKTVPRIREFLDTWRRCILSGIVDSALRKEITSFYRVPDFMNQESAFLYLCRTRELSGVVHLLSPAQHCFETDFPAAELRMFHWVGASFGYQRGLAALVIREHFEGLKRVLGNEDLRAIFGDLLAHGGSVPFSRRSSLIHRLDWESVKRLGFRPF